MTQAEDKDLVRRARDGDEVAFAELVERHQGRVYNHALRMMGTSEDAEEVLQDTFVQAYRNLRTFRGAIAFLDLDLPDRHERGADAPPEGAPEARGLSRGHSGAPDGRWRGDEIRHFARSALDDVDGHGDPGVL